MTDNRNEQISALIDDELPLSETHSMLERLKEDPELKATWARYQLISDAIRGEGTQIETFAIAERVRTRLADEPAIIARPGGGGKSREAQHNHWIKPAIGVALAASVAGATIMVLPDFSTSPPQPETAQLASAPATAPIAGKLQLAANNPQPVRVYTQPDGSRWKNLSQPEIESKLNRYLVDHNELASPAGIGSALPYASFVSYDTNR